MRTPIGVIIFLSLLLLIDLYVFQSVKMVTNTSTIRNRNLVVFSYWTVVALSVISFLLFVYTPQDFFSKKVRVYLFAMVIGLFLAKLLATTFFVIDDIRRIVQWTFSKAVALARARVRFPAVTVWATVLPRLRLMVLAVVAAKLRVSIPEASIRRSLFKTRSVSKR